MVKEITPQGKLFSIRKVKNQKKWNKEEDKLLLELAHQYNERHWKEISLHFYKKNPLQCFSRYKRIRPGIHKGAWTKEEDELIVELVKKYGTSWSSISKEMLSRNGKQIRDRYINVLDPCINRDKFTIEEDSMILQLYNKIGTKWSIIAKNFPHRTADMIKNRFYSSIKKKFHELIQLPNIMDSPLSTELKSSSEVSQMITHEENDNVSMLSLSNNIISNNLFDIQFFDLEEQKDSYINEHVSVNDIIMSDKEF